MRRAVENEESVSVELLNYRKDGTPFWNKVDIAPLRDEDGEVTHFVGFQTDITARKEAELAVERERENLELLVDRINGLLGDVTGELVAAESREEIDAALAERLADADPYVGAWVGEVDLPGETVVQSASAGTAPAFEVSLDSDDPTAKAVETGEMQVTLTDDLPADSPHRQAGAGLAAVPLVYRETQYGVLTVYAGAADAFNDREAVVLSALARAAATAINAVESRRMLTADEVVELELSMRDPDLFFVGLSRGRELEYGGAAPRDGDTVLMFLTVRDDDGETTAIEAARERSDVESADVLVEREDGTLLEIAAAAPLVDMLADRGARLEEVLAVDGEARIRVELPAGGDPRGLLEALQERYDGTELVAYHEHERPARTREQFVDELEDRLTEQQLTALRKAYLSGYFDPNRPVTGDELAASMEISRSTFHQHLRAAERKLVGGFLGDD
jgi:predicted DNA binding protein